MTVKLCRRPCKKIFTYHFFLRAEEGVALQSFVVLALDNVRKHFVVHLVCSAIGYSTDKGEKTQMRTSEKEYSNFSHTTD